MQFCEAVGLRKAEGLGHISRQVIRMIDGAVAITVLIAGGVGDGFGR